MKFFPLSPPTPFPAGRGRFLVFLCKGLRPLHPRAKPARRGGRGRRIMRRAGGLPQRCRITLPSLSPMGGTAVLLAGYFCRPSARRERAAVLLAGFASRIKKFYPPSPRPPSPMGKGEFLGFLMQGASPLASPGLNPGGTGAGAQSCTKRGRGRFWSPDISAAPVPGGSARRFYSPDISAAPVPGGGRGGFTRRICQPNHKVFPPSPQPPSPVGKGEIFSFLMQGASPLASPRLNPGGAGAGGGVSCASGGLPRRCRINLPSLSPTGGSGGLGRRLNLPHHRFFVPIPPTPFPHGEGGAQGYFVQGASPLASPGLNPGGAVAGAQSCAKRGARAERGRFVTGRGANGGLHQQFIREKFLGVWGLLSRSPQRFFVSSFLRIFVSSL